MLVSLAMSVPFPIKFEMLPAIVKMLRFAKNGSSPVVMFRMPSRLCIRGTTISYYISSKNF